MSPSDHSRFDELMSRYLDASLAGTEEHELLRYLSDEDLAARFYEMTQLDTEIAGLLAGSLRDEVMVELVWSDLVHGETLPPTTAEPVETVVPISPLFRRPKRQRGRWLALAAVLVGMLGVTAMHFFRTPAPAPVTKITTLQGEVYLVGPSGQVIAGDGQSLQGGGTVRTVGPDSRATVALTDGTEIALLGDTSFDVRTEPGKRRLFLEAGILRARVAKQPDDAPLVFGTAEAMATVRGTELAIVTDPSSTYLIVLRGAVGLRRSSGGPEVLVNAGFYGHVEPDGNFNPWPIARLPKALRDQLNLQP